jgi:hypothetical protein
MSLRSRHYEADTGPDKLSICHCTDCQALTGSPYRVTVICAGKQIRFTGKLPKIYRKIGDNRTRLQHFCGQCGSPLFIGSEGGLMIGAFAGAASAQH